MYYKAPFCERVAYVRLQTTSKSIVGTQACTETSEMHLYTLLIMPSEQFGVRTLVRPATEGCKRDDFAMQISAISDTVVEIMDHVIFALEQTRRHILKHQLACASVTRPACVLFPENLLWLM